MTNKSTGIFLIVGFEILDVDAPDDLECMEVFLVAYTCFNLNLEIFGEFFLYSTPVF
jgi:hypothetical protein